MVDSLLFRVGPEDASKRLDVFLSLKNSSLSRSRIKRLIEKGQVEVGGKEVKPGHRLKENDLVSLRIPAPEKGEASPEAIPLDVLYEDRHLLVVNKPAGMVVHPAAGNYSGTLVNALLHRCTDLSGIGGVLRPGIVHRLDKDTSGLLVVAKDDFTHQGLAGQFKAHAAERKYLGLLFGHPPGEGRVESDIGRHPVDRKRMSARPRRGRKAATRWKVLRRFRQFSLVEFTLETGRTHQIRVHLSSIGHPLLGDPLYGGRRRLSSVEPSSLRQALQMMRRQALHAASLGFVHPVTGEKIIFSSPLPPDLKEVLEILEKAEA
ncbi:MAG: RluA family pseudouridine synthase [Deltaproteobacteria bacterium]|nr:RluA family pseudouridine synthase [Deltaproteobacteria bacterium]